MFTKTINTGLIALLIGSSAAFAFNAPANKVSARLAVQWFSYIDCTVSGPNNYSILPGMPSCNSGSISQILRSEVLFNRMIPKDTCYNTETVLYIYFKNLLQVHINLFWIRIKSHL